ncbi:hypothetical protein pipiens_015130 [Culex pipiens pipiens]|uniref:C2H2-type domain-containing protein n=1 Tax=Culex pipiens pipiens TaxID=38569 RepID=A0ABD1CRZ5_CULPP
MDSDESELCLESFAPSPQPDDFEPKPASPSPDPLDIKEEPIEFEPSPQFQVAAPDPLQIQGCLFCFRELANGLGAEDPSLPKKIEFVLVAKFNFRKAPYKVPCCTSCVKMFNLFYTFKRSCLTALVRQDEQRKAKVLEPIELEAAKEKPAAVREKEPEALAELQQLLPEVTLVKVAKQTVQPKKPSVAVFNCSTCPATFIDKNEYGYHMNGHKDINPFKCGIATCQQAFPSPKACTQHEATCASTPKTCKICSLEFPTAAELEAHNTAHIPSVCPRCNGMFALAKDCQNHMTVCQGVENESQPGTSSQQSKKQRNDNNPEGSESSDQEGDSTGARSCRNCGHKFPLAGDILFHHQRKCGALRTRVKCPRCDKHFTRKGTLEAHLRRHDGIRPFQCGKPGCAKTFFNQGACANHEEGCGTLGFVCDVCGATLSTQGSLKLHREKHEEPKMQCNQCEKRFHDKRSLLKHMSVHSDERKYECKVCGKRFKSGEANRVHQRIHTQEKPYACPECDQRFTYNCSLKAHLEKKACLVR